jgi:hypothetical protein
MSAYELIDVAERVGVDEIWMIDQAAIDGIIEPASDLDGTAVPSKYTLAGTPEDLHVYAERLADTEIRQESDEIRIDRMWLHDLGVAEGAESLIDDEFLGQMGGGRRIKNHCEECGIVPYTFNYRPGHGSVCQDCGEELPMIPEHERN